MCENMRGRQVCVCEGWCAQGNAGEKEDFFLLFAFPSHVKAEAAWHKELKLGKR